MERNCFLRFMGDVMIGRLVNNKISSEGYQYPWGDVLPYLKQPGLNIINLETALTTSNKKVPKVFNFKADPDKIKTLKEANISIASIANNHILDFSEEGMIETINILEAAGIQHTGAGKNFQEARKAAIVDCNGIKIGIMSCTDNEPGWSANSSPGVYYTKIGEIDKLKKDIQGIREKVDILIISTHFGPNLIETPTTKEIKFAHDLIDLGIDIYYGHSAHIFQGVEIYKGKIIMYDTGDFIDDYIIGPELRNDRSFLFEIEVTEKKISGMKLLPISIKNMQVNFAKKDAKEWSIARMQYLSTTFGTKINDEGIVENFNK